jgi:hypothetical protein
MSLKYPIIGSVCIILTFSFLFRSILFTFSFTPNTLLGFQLKVELSTKGSFFHQTKGTSIAITEGMERGDPPASDLSFLQNILHVFHLRQPGT